MKKILNLSVISLLFLSIMSCSSDDTQTVATDMTAPVLISPEDGTSIVLTEGLETNVAMTLVWNHGDYDVPTEINYTVELALAGTNFAAPFVAGTTTQRVYPITVADLNNLAKQAGILPFEQGNLDVRVTSSLGTNDAMPMISNTLTVSVTPFAVVVVEDPKLYFVGAPQAYYGVAAWTPENGIPMRYIGDGTTKVFEAYVKIAAGEGFKFIGGLSWNEGNYGTIGGVQDGNIEDNGGSGDIKVAETDGSGLYYVQVDIDNLTYKAVKMNWGIIGSATAGAWDNETAMDYDFDTNKFTLTTTLADGEMKFRSGNTGVFIYNDAWKFNVGNSDPMVTYNPSAPNFAVTAGSHALELSLSLDGTATVSGI
jgi:hypothetical protein